MPGAAVVPCTASPIICTSRNPVDSLPDLPKQSLQPILFGPPGLIVAQFVKVAGGKAIVSLSSWLLRHSPPLSLFSTPLTFNCSEITPK